MYDTHARSPLPMNARCESALVGSIGRCSAVSSRAAIEIVVMIAGAFGKYRGEQIDIRPDGLRARSETRREALRKVAGRRVERAIQTAVVPLEHVAIGGRGLRPDIDDVEPASRRDVETQFEGCHRGLLMYHGTCKAVDRLSLVILHLIRFSSSFTSTSSSFTLSSTSSISSSSSSRKRASSSTLNIRPLRRSLSGPLAFPSWFRLFAKFDPPRPFGGLFGPKFRFGSPPARLTVAAAVSARTARHPSAVAALRPSAAGRRKSSRAHRRARFARARFADRQAAGP